MASAPVGDEAICQTFLCAVGKSASRQSASQSCTRAGTCNVDRDPFTHILLPQPSDATKSNDASLQVTSGLFLSPCTPPYCLQSLRGLPACLRDLCPQKRTQQENGTCTAEESSFFCVARHALAGGVTPDVWCWRLSLLWLPSQAASGSWGGQVNLALTCCPQRCASKVLRDAEDPCRFGAVGCSAERTLLFWKLVVPRICSVNVGQSRHRSNAGLALRREFPENEPLLASNKLNCACWANCTRGIA